jgi:uncharacterized membrane protein (UPF0136 family)
MDLEEHLKDWKMAATTLFGGVGGAMLGWYGTRDAYYSLVSGLWYGSITFVAYSTIKYTK